MARCSADPMRLGPADATTATPATVWVISAGRRTCSTAAWPRIRMAASSGSMRRRTAATVTSRSAGWIPAAFRAASEAVQPAARRPTPDRRRVASRRISSASSAISAAAGPGVCREMADFIARLPPVWAWHHVHSWVRAATVAIAHPACGPAASWAGVLARSRRPAAAPMGRARGRHLRRKRKRLRCGNGMLLPDLQLGIVPGSRRLSAR